MRGWTTRVAAGLAVGCLGLVGGASAPAPATAAMAMATAPEIAALSLADHEQPFTGQPFDDSAPVAAPQADPAVGATGELPTDPAPPSADVLPAGVTTVPTPAVVPDLPIIAGGPGIPAAVLAAYRSAAAQWAVVDPGCRLSWTVLAAIGRIESSHASGGRVDANGRTIGRILGIPLDGSPGVAAIRDSDGGVLDGDPVWDRAVGPMQFIPTTWAAYRTDGNRDGVANPNNVYDAAATAAHYLCARGGDLSTSAGLVAAIFRYNGSATYVRNVVSWALAYGSGVTATVSLPGPVPARPGPPTDPAVRSALPPPVAPRTTTAAAGPTVAVTAPPRTAAPPAPPAPSPTPVVTAIPVPTPPATPTPPMASPPVTTPPPTVPAPTPPPTIPPPTIPPPATPPPATPPPVSDPPAPATSAPATSAPSTASPPASSVTPAP